MRELPGKEKANEGIYLLSSSNIKSPVGFSRQRGFGMCLFREIQNSTGQGWESPDLSGLLAPFEGLRRNDFQRSFNPSLH